MVRQIASTFTITIKKQDEGYTIEANGSKGIRVNPQVFSEVESLFSDKHLTTRKALASEKASAPPDAIQKVGKALYNALFIPPIATAFGKAQGKVRGNSGVRLRLQIKPPELAALPWETLYDGQNWLSTQSSTPLVRQLILDADSKTLQNLQVRGALRILFVGASPEGLPKLKIEETATKLQKLLEQPINKKQIVFNVLLNATLEELQLELKKDYHILYFSGHGSPNGIYLDDGQGDDIKEGDRVVGRGPGDKPKKPVSAETLAKDLKGKQTRLVFLAACETSKASDESPLLEGFAQELAKQSKLPAIVAMQYYISDMQANTLTTHFFVGLAAGRPVDVALAEARNALISKGDVGRDVFAPVLYLQAEDGALFQKPKNWPVISLSVALVLAMIIGGAIARSREFTEINRLMGEAERHLASSQTLDARIYSLQAAQKLKQRIFPEARLKNKVLGKLSQAIYAGQERNRVASNQGRVYSMRFSPNGKFLAIGGSDDVGLWDRSNQQWKKLEGYQGGVDSVVFSPDSNFLVTNENVYDRSRLWNTAGHQLKEWNGYQNKIADRFHKVMFSPNGKFLAIGGSYISRNDNTVNLCDTSNHSCKQVEADLGKIKDVKFSPNSKILAYTTHNTVHLRDISGNKLADIKGDKIPPIIINPELLKRPVGPGISPPPPVDTFREPSDPAREHQRTLESIDDAKFSPDSNFLVTYQGNGTVAIWDTSGHLVHKLPGHQNEFSKLAFNPNGTLLVATVGSDSTVRLWDSLNKQWKKLEKLQGIKDIEFSPDGKLLTALGKDGILYLWDTSGGQNSSTQQWERLETLPIIEKVKFSSDGKLLMIYGRNATPQLWSIFDKKFINPKGLLGDIFDVAFHPNDKLATGGSDGIVRIWDISDPQWKNFEELQNIHEVKFSPDSKLLVASQLQDMVYLWDISSQKPKELKAPQDESIIKDVAFSPNGKILVASQKTGDPLKIWDISSQRWQKLEGQQWDKLAKLEGILHVEFSPDGKLLITTLGNGTVYLWDTAGQHWEELKSLQDVRNAEFSSDSKFLIVYQIDKVGIWDISGNKWSKKPEEPPIRERVKLSPDGKYVATIDEKNNNTLRLWDIPSQQWKDFEEKLQYIFNIDSEVEFSPNGKSLATINENSNILRLWDISGQQLKRFKPIPNIELVKFSPNGNLLSYPESDKTINLWDTFGEQLTELKTEQGELVGENRRLVQPGATLT